MAPPAQAQGSSSRPSSFVIIISTLAVLTAGLYPLLLRDLVFVFLGVGRAVQPISDFPQYSCRRIAGPGLEACEDMWFSERTRVLFAACSDVEKRGVWMPNTAKLNATGRSDQDAIIAIDVDEPVEEGFQYRILQTPDTVDWHGEGKLSLLGMTGIDYDDHIELYLVNNRPTLDLATGELLDNTLTGANTTIEHFSVDPFKEEMAHLNTFAHPQIATPNNIALDPTTNSFYFTNDHGTNKLGLSHGVSPFIGTGDVSYCTLPTPSSPTLSCKRASASHKFPNGLIRSHVDGLLYVPSVVTGHIYVYHPKPDGGLALVDTIEAGMPVDNLSQDADGAIWAAGFPDSLATLQAFETGEAAPATVLRLRRISGEGYEVMKVLEDRDAEVLPGATTVVHDSETGRLYLSGITSSFVTVCDRVGGIGAQKGEVEDGEEEVVFETVVVNDEGEEVGREEL